MQGSKGHRMKRTTVSVAPVPTRRINQYVSFCASQLPCTESSYKNPEVTRDDNLAIHEGYLIPVDEIIAGKYDNKD